MEDLVAKFIAKKDGRQRVLDEAVKVAARYKDGEKRDNSDVYVKLMRMVVNDGLMAIHREEERVKEVMDRKGSDKVKEKMKKTLNIIESFKRKDLF